MNYETMTHEEQVAHSKTFTNCPITGTEGVWLEQKVGIYWFGRNLSTPQINTIRATDYSALRREYDRMEMLRKGIKDPGSMVIESRPNAGGTLPVQVLIH